MDTICAWLFSAIIVGGNNSREGSKLACDDEWNTGHSRAASVGTKAIIARLACKIIENRIDPSLLIPKLFTTRRE